MSGICKQRKLHKAAAALMLSFTSGVLLCPGMAQADIGCEDNAVISNRIILIKEGEHQAGRDVNIQGNGTHDIWIYGGSPGGGTTPVFVNGSDTFIDVYSGYHDGQGVPVKNNIINVGPDDSLESGWKIYDDPAKLSGYKLLRLYDSSPNGSLQMNIIAGHAKSGEVSDNVINIRGGKLNGYVIASEAKLGSVYVEKQLHDNTVNIFNNADLLNAKIYGAAVFNDLDRTRSGVWGTNNTLNVYVKDVSVGELGTFNTYNLYVPLGTVSGDTMVTVAGGKVTDISRSTVNGIVAKTGSLPLNSTVNLLVNGNGVTDGTGTIYSGIHNDTGLSTGDINSKLYKLVVNKADSSHVVLKVVSLNRLHPSTKNIVQTKIPSLINRGADFLSGDAAQSAEAAGAQVYTPFFALSHSDMRHTTGSYVDMRGNSMVLGMSRKSEKNGRRSLLAPVIEYGYGNYDAYLDEGTHGQGKSRYYGMGIVFRNSFSDGRFYEGSLRGGRLNVDYSTNDYVYNGQKTHEHFDSSTFYAGVHFGVGREVNWKPRHKITYYGKFFYTHTGAEDIRLSNGQLYHTSHVNSERLRLGIRDSYEADNKNKLYWGVAWEHEFDGSAYATYDGLRTDTPRLRGNSYMLELGWVLKPKGNDHLSFDLSATGWLGRQRGVTGRFGINWMF